MGQFRLHVTRKVLSWRLNPEHPTSEPLLLTALDTPTPLSASVLRAKKHADKIGVAMLAGVI